MQKRLRVGFDVHWDVVGGRTLKGINDALEERINSFPAGYVVDQTTVFCNFNGVPITLKGGESDYTGEPEGLEKEFRRTCSLLNLTHRPSSSSAGRRRSGATGHPATTNSS